MPLQLFRGASPQISIALELYIPNLFTNLKCTGQLSWVLGLAKSMICKFAMAFEGFVQLGEIASAVKSLHG